jgi:hypothetical protein
VAFDLHESLEWRLLYTLGPHKDCIPPTLGLSDNKTGMEFIDTIKIRAKHTRETRGHRRHPSIQWRIRKTRTCPCADCISCCVPHVLFQFFSSSIQPSILKRRHVRRCFPMTMFLSFDVEESREGVREASLSGCSKLALIHASDSPTYLT